MKPLRTRLQEARQRLGAPWEVLERDYLLSWIIAGVARTDALRDGLVFKGGTALKKCFFGRYRFSEDLDFTALPDAPRADRLEAKIASACETAAKLLDEYAPVEILCERYEERQPHPGGQEAFTIRARFPWQRSPQTRVMVEVTVDEPILKPAEQRSVIHEYGEPLDVTVPVYALEEIVAEKLRAILQHVQKLHERGWSRSRARDYYDLWCVLGTYSDRMELEGFVELLSRKCTVRHVGFDGPGDFFQDAMLSDVAQTWERWLGPLVPNLPSFETVISDLRPRVASLVPGT